ncbi:MAG: hypothetical protein HY228_02675 [Candidatus Yonathbacteria bacterium]|nr:hypothetical protein [Candidatus Yonathbacteria bacterium]
MGKIINFSVEKKRRKEDEKRRRREAKRIYQEFIDRGRRVKDEQEPPKGTL